MEVQKDFKELLESLNARGVEYVIVGAHALAFHGVPRYTGDIDLLVKPSRDNARRIMEGLTATLDVSSSSPTRKPSADTRIWPT